MMRFLFTLSLLFGLPIRSVAAGLAVGIPRTEYCNTSPYHARETLTFPTTPTGTKVCTFTIPAYGRGVRTIDTNGDTVPDIPPACGDVTRNSGDPLTGFGMVETTGAISTSRTTMDPRAFTLPRSTRPQRTAVADAAWGDSRYAGSSDCREDPGHFRGPMAGRRLLLALPSPRGRSLARASSRPWKRSTSYSGIGSCPGPGRGEGGASAFSSMLRTTSSSLEVGFRASACWTSARAASSLPSRRWAMARLP